MAKELKDSTRTLCRQLQDNPDVDGNLKKIKDDKKQLIDYIDALNGEMRDLSFTKFRDAIKAGLEEQGQFEKLREDEKNCNQEIKAINEKFKQTQDEYAKEANENNQEILNLKKNVNETKTEKQLTVEYKRREVDGKYLCQKRIYDKQKEKLQNEIKELEDELRTENLVSERIRKFVQSKTSLLNKKAEDQEKQKEVRTQALEKDRENIFQNKTEDEDEITRIHQLILLEAEEKSKRDAEERERIAELERKRLEKMGMEDAARYI